MSILLLCGGTLYPFTRSQIAAIATCLTVGFGLVWWDNTRDSQSPSTSRLIDYGHVITLSTLGSLIGNMFKSSAAYTGHVYNRTCSVYKKIHSDEMCDPYFGDFTPQEQIELDLFCYRSSNPAMRSGCGMLLQGPPGSGKTSFVREFARQSGSTLFVVNTAQLNSGYAGDGAMMIETLFSHATQECAKGRSVIVFLDEIDVIGSRNAEVASASARSQHATLTSLLLQMDAIPPNMMVIGATNKAEDLDPALKRSGRIDTILTKELPTLEQRHAFVLGIKKHYPCLSPLDPDELAHLTANCSYGDLNALCHRCIALHNLYGGSPEELVDASLQDLQNKKATESISSQSERRIEREEEHLEIAKRSLRWSQYNTGLAGVNTLIHIVK
jgi:hypothetical protein